VTDTILSHSMSCRFPHLRQVTTRRDPRLVVPRCDFRLDLSCSVTALILIPHLQRQTETQVMVGIPQNLALQNCGECELSNICTYELKGGVTGNVYTPRCLWTFAADRVSGSDPSVTDYILEQPAKCPSCRRDILEKTLIEPK
jgi:hypothetical protein